MIGPVAIQTTNVTTNEKMWYMKQTNKITITATKIDENEDNCTRTNLSTVRVKRGPACSEGESESDLKWRWKHVEPFAPSMRTVVRIRAADNRKNERARAHSGKFRSLIMTFPHVHWFFIETGKHIYLTDDKLQGLGRCCTVGQQRWRGGAIAPQAYGGLN